jgi:hypothetical protein
VARGGRDCDCAAIREAEERDRFGVAAGDQVVGDGSDVIVLVQVEAEDPFALAVAAQVADRPSDVRNAARRCIDG